MIIGGINSPKTKQEHEINCQTHWAEHETSAFAFDSMLKTVNHPDYPVIQISFKTNMQSCCTNCIDDSKKLQAGTSLIIQQFSQFFSGSKVSACSKDHTLRIRFLILLYLLAHTLVLV